MVKKKSTKKKNSKKVERSLKTKNKRIKIGLRGLVIFAIMFILSLILYSVSFGKLLEDLFLMFSIIFGFLALAFLIVIFISLLLKAFKK